jgi:protein gp37
VGDQTSIGYPDKTWSPWRTCSHAVYPPGHPKAGEVHPGCLNCYAEALNHFHTGWNGGQWGPGAPRTVAAASSWDTVRGWARTAAMAGKRIRIFPSLCDPLDEEAPKDAQQRFWQLIRETAAPLWSQKQAEVDLKRIFGGVDWLILTKRPWRWELIPADVRRFIWLGTSISDQPTANFWIPELLKAEGVRLLWCSYEPALGPVDFGQVWFGEYRCPVCSRSWWRSTRCGDCDRNTEHRRGLEWVICGGESGGQRRPFEVAWMESAALQCKRAGVAFWAKQDAAFRSGQQGRIPPELWARKEVPHVA